MPDCGLCHLVPEDMMYQDDICAIVKCKSCDVPMVVLKRHDPNGTEAEVEHMKRVLICFRRKGTQYIDEQMRSIPEHKHIHLRG